MRLLHYCNRKAFCMKGGRGQRQLSLLYYMSKKYIHVICIGCGGTGGVFLKEFGRFMATCGNPNILLTMIDGDRVEEKNLQRQPYAKEDIYQFKATSLSEAMRSVYDLKKIYAFPVYLEDVDQLRKIIDIAERDIGSEEFLRKSDFLHILIGAVDNHRARQLMNDFFEEEKDLVYIDAANEYTNGEVVYSYKRDGKIGAPARAYYFPDILSDRSPRASELSCGVINISNPQHQCTNICAGNLILSKLTRFLCGEDVRFGITYFDIASEDMVFREWLGEKNEIS